MQIKAEALVAMLKKMDEMEEKAGAAFSSCDREDSQIAVEKMRELRAMLYSALTREEEAVPYPVTYPVVVPYREVPWWEQTHITCTGATGAE